MKTKNFTLEYKITKQFNEQIFVKTTVTIYLKEN